MPIHVTREEFYRAIDDVKTLQQATNSHLDVLNGRVRRSEIKIAVMWVLWLIFGATVLALIRAFIGG